MACCYHGSFSVWMFLCAFAHVEYHLLKLIRRSLRVIAESDAPCTILPTSKTNQNNTSTPLPSKQSCAFNDFTQARRSCLPNQTKLREARAVLAVRVKLEWPQKIVAGNVNFLYYSPWFTTFVSLITDIIDTWLDLIACLLLKYLPLGKL